MSGRKFEVTDPQGQPAQVIIDVEAGTWMASGKLYAVPKLSSSGAGMLAFGLSSPFLVDDTGERVSFRLKDGKKYGIRLVANGLANPEEPTEAMRKAKAARKAANLRAKLAQAEAEAY